MKIKDVRFIKSCASVRDLPEEKYPEVAFVGRSNVGKSSLINYLLNRKNMAKTSSTPGKTQLINYFLVNEEFYLVDLPGYGFAKVSKEMQKSWGKIITSYLENSQNLLGVCLLLDIRRLPNEHDKQMLLWLVEYQIPTLIILTKSDKLSTSQQLQAEKNIKNQLGLEENFKFFKTSSSKRQGKDNLWDTIKNILGIQDEIN